MNYAVGPNQSVKALATQDNFWRVVKHPTTRSTGSSYDFMIAYKIGYDTTNNYPDASDDSYHTECQPYQVSWCGDGVVDTQYSESCDDGNSNGLPGKCNNSCSGNTPPEVPKCDQEFASIKLRFGNLHRFYDDYTNPDSFGHLLRNFKVIFEEPYDYNNSSVSPNFVWSNDIKNTQYIVAPGTQDMRVIDSTNQYQIVAPPPVRKSDNLTVKYTVYVQNVN